MPYGSAKLASITWRGGTVGRSGIETSGGHGDCDLFVKLGGAPTTNDNDYSSADSGTSELVTIDNPTAGDWFILLQAFSAYSGVTLKASY